MSIGPTYRGLDRRVRPRYLWRPGGRRGSLLKRVDAVVVLAAGLAVSFGVWWWVSSPQPEPAAPPAPLFERASADDLVVVHVSGAVESPGVVRLPVGSRAIDAVEAAGGARFDADLSQVNLAAELVDGAQVRVPGVDDSQEGGQSADDGPVSVNQADASMLETLPGVGPVLAGRIVDHRQTHGPFRSVEDLLDVSGIGESILARLRPHIRVP